MMRALKDDARAFNGSMKLQGRSMELPTTRVAAVVTLFPRRIARTALLAANRSDVAHAERERERESYSTRAPRMRLSRAE